MFAVTSSSRIHILVSYNEEWKQSREHSGWIFTGKESKDLDVSREITYGNLIDRLYDLMEHDRSKYDFLLKVIYQLEGGIIAPTVISNDEDLGFFLDEISMHRTPLCVLVVERTTPPITNPTQDSQFPSFVPEMAEAQKIHGLEDVPGKTTYETLINDNPPITEDPRDDPYLSLYYK